MKLNFFSKKSLSDKVIIITGASDGQGREIAIELGKHKASVILVARRKTILEKIEKEIRASGGTALAVSTDLRQSKQITALVQTVMKQFGRIDILINVAGVGYYDWIEEQSIAELTEQYMTNVVGMVDIIRQVVPHMKRQRAGHIINFASYASQIATPPLTIYSSTKYAVEGLTDGLRRELSPWNIKVTRVHPSAVDTNFNKKATQHHGIHYPYDHITGVTTTDVVKAVIRCLYHPRSVVYVAKRKLLIDSVVTINRYLPGIIDLIFLFRVKALLNNDKNHDLQV
jgi:short-subunit dehydrogenase